MPLTFMAGRPADVFAGDLASAVAEELRNRYQFVAASIDEPYRSEPVNAAGWRELQNLFTSMLGENTAPEITAVDGYQVVYVPSGMGGVETLPISNLADPLHVASLTVLIEHLTRFAERAQLPTGDLELMELAADYLEAEVDSELDFQTYVQLMLSARQAVARAQALWIVT